MSEKKSLTLYDISSEVLALEELLMMDAGEVTDELEKLQEEITLALMTKTDSIFGLISKLQDESDNGKNYMKKIAQYCHARENAISRIKNYALMALETTGKDKFTGVLGQISLVKPRKILKIEDEKNVPVEFLKQEVSIKKAELTAAIKNGLEVEGCYMVDGAKGVRVSMKSVK